MFLEEHGQLPLHRAVVRIGFRGVRPALDRLPELTVYVFERRARGVADLRVVAACKRAKQLQGPGFLLRFVAEEGQLESDALVGGVERPGLLEQGAGGLRIAHLELDVAQLLANVGSLGGERQGASKMFDGRIVVLGGKRLIGLVQLAIGGVVLAAGTHRTRAIRVVTGEVPERFGGLAAGLRIAAFGYGAE